MTAVGGACLHALGPTKGALPLEDNARIYIGLQVLCSAAP